MPPPGSVADCLLCFWSFLSNSQFHKNFTVLSLCLSLWLSVSQRKCLHSLSWWDEVVMIDCQRRISLRSNYPLILTAWWNFGFDVRIVKILVRCAWFKSTTCYIPSSSNIWQYFHSYLHNTGLYKNTWYRFRCDIAGRVDKGCFFLGFFFVVVSAKVIAIRMSRIFTVASHSFQNVKVLLKYQKPVVTLYNTDICWYLFSTS